MAVVASWVVVSGASIALGLSGGEVNEIGARGRVVDTGFGIAVNIQNKSSTNWQSVQLKLEPGGWIYRQAVLRPKERIALQVTEFERPGAGKKSEHPDRDYWPRSILISTKQGSYLVKDTTKRKKKKR